MSRLLAFFVMVLLVVALFAACQEEAPIVEAHPRPVEPPPAETSSPASTPTREVAVADVGAFLNLRTGRWTVVDVLMESGGTEDLDGREAYVMHGRLILIVEASGKPHGAQLENDPWLAEISGEAGDEKNVPVVLTWLKTDSGWKLRTLAIEEAHGEEGGDTGEQ